MHRTYIAISSSARRRVRRCVVSTVLGKRWQTTPVRDHWPLEVRARLRQTGPITTSAEQKTVRWNKHAILRAPTDPEVAQPFLLEVQAALRSIEQRRWCDVQAKWRECSEHLFGIGQKHFGMQRQQRNPKLTPATFRLLSHKRELMCTFLSEVDMIGAQALRNRRMWLQRVAFCSLQLHAVLLKARRRIKQDVRNCNNHLADRLREADRVHDSREAWSLSRQLAGRAFKHNRPPPASKIITRTAWLNHFQEVASR